MLQKWLLRFIDKSNCFWLTFAQHEVQKRAQNDPKIVAKTGSVSDRTFNRKKFWKWPQEAPKSEQFWCHFLVYFRIFCCRIPSGVQKRPQTPSRPSKWPKTELQEPKIAPKMLKNELQNVFKTTLQHLKCKRAPSNPHAKNSKNKALPRSYPNAENTGGAAVSR